MAVNPMFLFCLAVGLQIIVGFGWIYLFVYIVRREKKYMAIVVRSMIPRRLPPTFSSPTKRLMAALYRNDEDDEEEEELDYQEAIAEAERIISESQHQQ